MEEATLDHGLDRLPFLPARRIGACALLASLCLAAGLARPAFATTFGPISVAGQTENASYVVHGRILGAGWAAEERRSRRPYTHWRMQVLDQAKGADLGAEITIRQPGGELGGMGYHVAGSAKFSDGEEVFVNLRDTEEQGVKEVTGLASGKYTVAPGEGGKPQLTNGIGFVLQDERGRPISPEEFIALVKRLDSGRASEADRNVFVSRNISHDHDPVLEKRETEARSESATKKVADNRAGGTPDEKNPAPELQQNHHGTDEPKGSSVGWWVSLAMVVLALIAGFIWFRKR